MKKSFIISIAIVFVALTLVFVFLVKVKPEFDLLALEAGNVLMLLLAMFSYLMVGRQLNGRPQAFVSGVYSATFLKILVCMFTILIYVVLNRKSLYVPIVFVFFGTYLVYSVVETIFLQRMAKASK